MLKDASVGQEQQIPACGRQASPPFAKHSRDAKHHSRST